MKIIIAPNAFKGNLSAWEVACCIEEGLRQTLPGAKIIKVPIADGGDGTVEALVRATGGRILFKKVDGPLAEPVWARFGILGDGQTAVIEMATASGLALVPLKKRNPLKTSTYGTGQLIKAALDKGCRRLIIGIGGSATVDGGAGMAQALGAKLLDKSGQQIGRGGAALENLNSIDISGMDKRLKETKTIVACDVTNPLLGRYGAARVYSPQKGATPSMVKRLELCLSNLAQVIRRDLGLDVRDIPGAGAAGGLGAGLMAFLDAQLKSGVELVIEASGLEKRIKNATLVVTGEGRMDEQTPFGKAPAGVARLAKKYSLPVIALVGQISGKVDQLHECGIDAIFSIVRSPLSLKQAIKESKISLIRTAEEVGRLLSLLSSLRIKRR